MGAECNGSEPELASKEGEAGRDVLPSRQGEKRQAKAAEVRASSKLDRLGWGFLHSPISDSGLAHCELCVVLYQKFKNYPGREHSMEKGKASKLSLPLNGFGFITYLDDFRLKMYLIYKNLKKNNGFSGIRQY